MSETVQIALITLASGLVGALVGAFTTLTVAKHNSVDEAEKRLWTERHLCYSRLVNAFNVFIAAIASGKPDSEELAAYNEFHRAYAKANLLCEKETMDPLECFLRQANQFGETRMESSELRLAYERAIVAMRKELLPQKKTKRKKRCCHHKNA